MKNKKWVLDFVPTKPTLTRDILKKIQKAGRKWNLSTGRGKKNGTEAGIVKSLSHYLNELPEVESVKQRNSHGNRIKLFFKR